MKSSLFGNIKINKELDDLFKKKPVASSSDTTKSCIEIEIEPKTRALKKSQKDSSRKFKIKETNKVENKVENSLKQAPLLPLPLGSTAYDQLLPLPLGSTAYEQKIETDFEKKKREILELIEKNKRTVFVGNISTFCAIEKEKTKLLKNVFSQFGKVESIRFRSLAFSEKMPRKQAFIAKKLHDKRDTLNAYVVFSQIQDAKNALSLNGSLFLEKHLRVDHSEHRQQKKRDSKRSVFLGNLDFNISDEKLWDFFADVGEIEYVRCIRDSKTNVGKGFGYVQFAERSSVPLALKLDNSMLQTRKIRVTKAEEKLAQVSSSKSDRKIVEGARASRGDKVLVRKKSRKDGAAGQQPRTLQKKAKDLTSKIKQGGIQKKSKDKPRKKKT